MRVLARGVETLARRLPAARAAARSLVPQDPRITRARSASPRAPRRRARRRPGRRPPRALPRARPREPSARVERVLGPADDPRVQTDAVIHAHDLPLEFPPDVAARGAPPAAARSRPHGRCASALDLRELPLVTIDGENARDFDDAVLVEPLGTGFRLTVAVADVAHYVPEDGADRSRGPGARHERLLPGPRDPHAARGAVERPLQPAPGRGSPGAGRCGSTSTPRGRPRAAEFLDARDAERRAPHLHRGPARARRPRSRASAPRSARSSSRSSTPSASPRRCSRAAAPRGAIDFDLPEAEILLDLRGRPEQIVRAERNVAHRLIEECMLAANEAVARELMRRRLPALHRVHEPPDPDARARPRALPRGIRAAPSPRARPSDARRVPGGAGRRRGTTRRRGSSTPSSCARCSRRATRRSRSAISASP